MNNDDVISTLNDLIETCKDGEQGFRTCAEDIKDTQMKSFFTSRAQSCAEAAAELRRKCARWAAIRKPAAASPARCTAAGSTSRAW